MSIALFWIRRLILRKALQGLEVFSAPGLQHYLEHFEVLSSLQFQDLGTIMGSQVQLAFETLMSL